jgi:hypothetical protein
VSIWVQQTPTPILCALTGPHKTLRCPGISTSRNVFDQLDQRARAFGRIWAFFQSWAQTGSESGVHGGVLVRLCDLGWRRPALVDMIAYIDIRGLPLAFWF